MVRVLIVGAGVAGLTLAALLEQQGRDPVIVERTGTIDDGYALGLYPLGSSVLHTLGAYSRLVQRSLAAERYLATNPAGRVLQSLSMSVLTDAVGPLLLVARRDLVEVLAGCLQRNHVRRGVCVAALEQRADSVRVRYSDRTSGVFDVVVGCDGMSSATRSLVFGPATGLDSGWTLWTWWAELARFDPRLVAECWGPALFVGAYPVPGRVMYAAGGPAQMYAGEDPAAVLAGQLTSVKQAHPIIAAAGSRWGVHHPWPMSDVRAERWVEGRVALCGDAAAGFLPTAGVGASAAMRSAAGLADELSRADGPTAPLALARFEKRCRPTVEAYQDESRRLGRVMFVRSPLMARARDEVVARYPARRALRRIIDSARHPF